METIKEQHESYGLIRASRCQGKVNLFGSSISHNNFITIVISKASRERDLSNYWYSNKEEIVEVMLSPTQFADFITSLNYGIGVPCTINWLMGKGKVEGCPSVDERELFEQEFKQKIKKTVESSLKAISRAKEILEQKTIKVAERDELRNLLGSIHMELTNGAPFIQTQFNESMDKVVKEAKGEFDAFVSSTIMSMGLEKLQEKLDFSSQISGLIEQHEDQS